MASTAQNIASGSEHARSALRHAAAELLTEATERGDLAHETVSWAVGRLLMWANSAEDIAEGRELTKEVCTDPDCTIPRRPGRPMHGPHTFRARTD